MSLIVSEYAQADILATARWYDRQPGRYGDAFNDEVLVAIRRISGSSRLYPLAEDGIPGREIREYLIDRFQQRVIYEIKGDDVLVVAVVHASRREGAWHRKLPST